MSTTAATAAGPPTDPEQAASAAPGRRPEGGRYRVLVVDDAAAIRQLLKVNLELEGFEVRTAEDGAQGVETARAWRPDVVTMDVMMPRLGGFDALELMRADASTADVPVVMVTARMTESDRSLGERLGADGYLGKPFEPAELVALVTRLAAHGRR